MATSSSASISSEPAASGITNLRRISPRRSLPGNRAILGGALVAVAVLGTYAALTQTGKSDKQTVVVAAHDIAPGTRLTAGDLKTIKLDSTASLNGHVISSLAKLNGAIALGPLRAGDIAQPGSFATASSATPYLEVSFSVPAARALDGNLQSGETVDVLTTDKSATLPVARVAAEDANVLRVQTSGSGSIGHTGDVTVTVGVNSRTEAAAIAAAVDQGQITLVRTTGIAR